MVDIDTTQIKSYNELIEMAKGLKSNRERIDLLGKYFFENVTYAYEFVDILGQSNNYDQQILMEVQEKYDVWDEEQRVQALLDVRKYLKREMAKRFHNRELLEQTLETRMKVISEQYGKIFEAKEGQEKTFEKKQEKKDRHTISLRSMRRPATPRRIANLVGMVSESGEQLECNLTMYGKIEQGDMLGAMQVYEPYAIYENGLIRNAVCQEYAPWIKKYCDDLNIPCEIVTGKGTVNHAWVLIKLVKQLRYFDPTNMAFIRDGYGENPTNAEPEEWLWTSIDRMFQMQEGRAIHSIGDTKGLMITSKNYEQYRETINQAIGYDYSKYESYEQLIEAAKKIKNQEEQIRFICGYIKQTAQYDYRTLFNAICTYGANRVYYEDINLAQDTYQAELLEEAVPELKNPMIKLRKVIRCDGENPIISKLIELNTTENPEGNLTTQESAKQYATRVWKEIILPEIKSHTSDSGIIAECLQEYEEYVAKSVGTSIVGIQNQDKQLCGAMFYDMSYVLVNNMGQIDRRHPCEEHNGLLIKGVCKHYAEFLHNAFDDLKIENALVGGISECNHAWNVVRVNGAIKYIDTTREVFIRDGYGKIPKQETGKWILCDAKDMFEMQPGRRIDEINETKLQEEITLENFEQMQYIVEEALQQKDGLKSFAEKGLREGADAEECANALSAEKTKELNGQTQG